MCVWGGIAGLQGCSGIAGSAFGGLLGTVGQEECPTTTEGKSRLPQQAGGGGGQLVKGVRAARRHVSLTARPTAPAACPCSCAAGSETWRLREVGWVGGSMGVGRWVSWLATHSRLQEQPGRMHGCTSTAGHPITHAQACSCSRATLPPPGTCGPHPSAHLPARRWRPWAC